MNSTDETPDYKKLYQILVTVFEKVDYFNYGHHDETFCSMRVFETAKELIKKINQPVKKEVVLVATILHDIGKSKLCINEIKNMPEENARRREEWQSHVKKSVLLVKEILLAEGYSPKFTEQVCFLVGHHNKVIDNLDSRSIELQILQDADLLADSGIVDSLRCFCFGAIYKRSMVDTIKYLMSRTNRITEDGRLNLHVSKELAKEKTYEATKLISKLTKLIDSELI